ncbi:MULTISPECIES: fimbrial protein [unclassified Brenneria]|uniref:fimbrial protein n=1 Tax=unclassified Brenneria TaxID=2634434 RepID=UPI0029C4977F|nr:MULTISPECIES: fimbrial protein [unclassified Brenneria]MDX5627702.1 fimbrial protein [Brenneria sp. L3-3Z]MDX5695207.1 fimbrial protein [Brenneria sp. L4-2C]
MILSAIWRRRASAKHLALAAGLWGGLFSAHAELGSTNMRLTATLVSNSCAVSVASQEQTVNMGTLAAKQFSAGKAGADPVRFAVNLERCGSAVSSVSATFSGTADANDSTLLALNSESTAAHVGIAILDKDRNRIPLGGASEQYPLTAGVSNAQLVFYGQYVATQDSVTAGSANGDATFTLTYQ